MDGMVLTSHAVDTALTIAFPMFFLTKIVILLFTVERT